MFAFIENGEVKKYPCTIWDIRKLKPNSSIPDTDQGLEDNGCCRVYFSTQPEYSPNTQVLTEGTPVFDTEAQRWTQVWNVINLTPEEIAQREEVQRQANKATAEQLLSESDWSDKPSVIDTTKPLHLVNAAEWEAYRDALRLIAVRPPVTVTEWPVKPEEIWS